MRTWGPYLLAGLAAALIALFAIQPWSQDPEGAMVPAHPESAGLQVPDPPTQAELEHRFEEHRLEFEAMRDLTLGLPYEALTLQVDFFALDEGGWSEHEPGVWWPHPAPNPSPAGIHRSLEEVLAEVGLRAEAYAQLRAFVAKHQVLGVARWTREPYGELVIFRPVSSLLGGPVERAIVWHADPEPYEEESTYVRSEAQRYPQRTTETSLGVPGWFVRTTTREGMR